jgi:hypothetical protein
MLLNWFWAVVDWSSIPMMAAVTGILVWKRLRREFPFFFWFLVVTQAVGVLRFVAQFGTPLTYYYAYWASGLAFEICNILAVYELFARRLFARFHKTSVYRWLFPVAALVISLFAWLASKETSSVTTFVVVINRVLEFVAVALLVFFIALMMIMGRVWTRYEFGIAFGLVINSAGSLITSAMWVRTHYHWTTIDRLPAIALDISCILWLYCFWSSDGKRTPAAPPLDPAMLHEARSWETMLKDWLTPGKSKR